MNVPTGQEFNRTEFVDEMIALSTSLRSMLVVAGGEGIEAFHKVAAHVQADYFCGMERILDAIDAKILSLQEAR